MKITNFYKASLSIMFMLVMTVYSHAQFNNPIIQVGLGIAEPMGDMKGTYFNYATLQSNGFQFLVPDPNLYVNNYGAKTGLTFFGNGKLNFDKYGIIRGVAGVSFSTFNTFEATKDGNIAGLYHNNNTGNFDTLPVPATFNYVFNTFGFNLGLEIAPTSFTNKFSPYFGARIAFNSLNSKISYTKNRLDTTVFSASGFRIGVMFDAGIEFKFNKAFGMVLGANFNLGNLLLKNTDAGIASNQEWGSTNGSLNDDDGQFWSSLYNVVHNNLNYSYSTKKKNINWGSIYLGLNIYLGGLKGKQPPPKK